jgi:hypothetical protein
MRPDPEFRHDWPVNSLTSLYDDAVRAFAPPVTGTPGREKVPFVELTPAVTPRELAVLLYHLLLFAPGSTAPVAVSPWRVAVALVN